MSEDETQSPVKKRNLDGEMANAALHGETDKIVRLFGSAAREHYAAYAGRNHEVSNTHGALRTIVEQKEANGAPVGFPSQSAYPGCRYTH